MADAEVAAAAEATAAAASSSGASATAAPGAVATGGAGTTAATSAAPAVPVKSADAIVDVMILKLDQAPAMAAAYRDIATAAVDDTFRNAFRTAGGFPFFSKGLTTHLSSAEVVVEACKALRLLSRNADNVAALVSQEDGVKSLLAVLPLFKSNPAVMEHAFAAVRNITLHQRGQSAMVAYDGIPTLLEALREHMTTAPSVVEQACAALQNITGRPEARAPFIECGGMKAIVAVLGTYMESSPIILLHACVIIRNTTIPPQDGRTAFRVAEGIPSLVLLLKTHVANAGVMREACAAVASVCYQCAENQTIVASFQGPAALDAVAAAHKDFPPVLEAARAAKRFATEPVAAQKEKCTIM